MTYAFHCDECGEQFEQMHCPLGTEECLCPGCGETAPRVFAPATIVMPSNEWCKLTRRDFLPDPKGEHAKSVYPLGLAKKGTWM